MAEQTTSHGLTVEQIDNAYEVLEVLRENLKDDGMTNLSEIANEAHYLVQQYDEGADWSQDWELPEVGDILVDPESDHRFGSGRVEICEVTQKPARCHWVDETKRTVASHNPTHPTDAPIVKGRYVDGSDKVYAFPCTRLEEPWP